MLKKALCTIFVFLMPDSTCVFMSRIVKKFILFLLVVQLFSPLKNYAETTFSSDSPEQKAIALFEEGKFDEALPVFEDLIRLYPDDKKLNYYLGASLLETKNYGARARQALLASVSKKDNPEKIDWYLGVAYHSENEYLTALDHYKRFEKEARGKLKKELGLEETISLCEQGINPFIVEETADNTEPLAADTISRTADTGENQEDKPVSVPENIPVIPNALYDSVIAFQVNPEIVYMKLSQFKNAEGKMNFVKAWLKKTELDSVTIYTDSLRKKYATLAEDQRQSLAEQIIGNEKRIINLTREIPDLNLVAHQLESGYWEKASADEMREILAQNQALTDSLKQSAEEKQKEINSAPPDEVTVPALEKPEPVKEDTSNKGIVYKVQIGAFRKEPPDWTNRLFKKLSLIRKIDNYKDGSGVTVYTTGELRSYADAVEMQKQVKVEGVRDAIIAAYKDGVRIKVSEARKLNGE